MNLRGRQALLAAAGLLLLTPVRGEEGSAAPDQAVRLSRRLVTAAHIVPAVQQQCGKSLVVPARLLEGGVAFDSTEQTLSGVKERLARRVRGEWQQIGETLVLKVRSPYREWADMARPQLTALARRRLQEALSALTSVQASNLMAGTTIGSEHLEAPQREKLQEAARLALLADERLPEEAASGNGLRLFPFTQRPAQRFVALRFRPASGQEVALMAVPSPPTRQ